jgi:hypothetical protein
MPQQAATAIEVGNLRSLLTLLAAWPRLIMLRPHSVSCANTSASTACSRGRATAEHKTNSEAYLHAILLQRLIVAATNLCWGLGSLFPSAAVSCCSQQRTLFMQVLKLGELGSQLITSIEYEILLSNCEQ